MNILLNNKIILLVSTIVLILSFIITPFLAQADFNQQINYQGKLTDSSGVAVADGTYNMNFWLLASSTAATSTAVWSEVRTTGDRVQVTNGLFSVMLGEVSSLSSVDFNQTLYLGVEIGGTSVTPTWDGEMSPRKILGAVPAAFEASNAQTLDNLATTSFLRSDAIDTMEATSSSALLTLIQNGAGKLLSLFSGATEMFTVLNNGNVGIATTTPSEKLTVIGNSYINGNLTLTGALKDSTSATGTLGMILKTTGTSTQWVATSTLGLGNGTFLGLSDTPSSFTANRLMFTNSGGTALTDSASLVFDGTNFGIGTSTPNTKLHLYSNDSQYGSSITLQNGYSSSYPFLRFHDSNESYSYAIGLDDTQNKFAIGYSADGNATSITSPRLVINTSGYVGIGTTSPSYLLDVAGDVRAQGDFLGNGFSNTFIRNASVIPSGYVEPTPLNFRFDSNAIPHVDRWATASATGLTSSQISTLFALDGIVDINGKGDPLIIEVTDINIGTTANTQLWPYVFMHADNNIATVNIKMELRKNAVWETLYDGALNEVTVAQVSSTAASATGVRWTFTGMSGATYVRNLGLMTRNDTTYAWTLKTAGGDVWGDVNISGDVGIGTTTPNSKLTVAGDINISDTSTGYKLGSDRILYASTTNSSALAGIGAGQALLGDGIWNSAFGHQSLYSATSSDSNTAVGFRALYLNTAGANNTAIGAVALNSNTTGLSNTANGYASLYSNINGSYNTALGFNAGRYLTDGTSAASTTDYSLFLGYNTKALTDNDQNAIVIGYNTNGLGSNTVVLGNDSIVTTALKGNIGIGTTTPSDKLTVVGNSYLGGGLTLTGALKDSTSATGTLGMIMQTTGTSTQWVATSTLGLGNGTFLGLTDTPSSFTANRLMFTNSGGTALTDSASLVFDGTNFGIGTSTPNTKLYVDDGTGTGWSATLASNNPSLGFYDKDQNAFNAFSVNAGQFLIQKWTSPTVWSTNPVVFDLNAPTGSLVLNSSGNVGIGTTTPGNKLTVAGDINISDTSTGYKLGNNRILYASTTNFSILVGNGAGQALLDDGLYNTALGYRSLYAATSSDENTAIGYQTLYSNTSGANNVAIGTSALFSNATGSSNTANGRAALYFNTAGSNNTANGRSALYYNTTGNNNVSMGYLSLLSNTTGSNNTANGVNAFSSNTTGSYNTALGTDAGRYLTDGTSAASTTDYSLFLGYNTKALTDNDQNAIVIGYNTNGLGSNTVVLGNDSIVTTALKGNIGIGTTTPSDKLTVVGNTYLNGGLTLTGALKDSTSATGTLGMILKTTGTSTQWVATSTLGLGNGTFLGLTDTPSSFTANRLMFTNSGGTALTDSASLVFDGTNFGIGTSTPDQKLSVLGNTRLAGALIMSSSTGSFTTSMATVPGTAELQPLFQSSQGYFSFKNANTGAPRMYLMPNGAASGTTAKFEMFNTDYMADSTNYSGFNIFTNNVNNEIHFGANRNGSATRLKMIIGGEYLASSLTETSPKIEFNTDDTLFLTGSSVQLLGSTSELGLTVASTGNVSIGTTSASSRLLVYEDNTGTSNSNGFTVEQDGSGDSLMHFLLTGTQRFTMGIDNSDSDKFKIGTNADLGSSNLFTLTTGGSVGIATTTPSEKLTVIGNTYLNGGLTLTGALKDSTSATGTLGMILKTTGTSTQWVATSTLGLGNGTFLGLTDTPSSFTANRLMFTNSGGTALTDSASLVFDGTNFGIGTSTPGNKLTVAGDINISDTSTGYKLGNNRILYASTTNFSTLVGNGAGQALLGDGLYNTALGYQALYVATSSDDNVAVGFQSLYNNTSGGANVALGNRSLYNNTTGNYNTANGSSALYSNTTGSFNTANGVFALYSNITGSSNTALGYQSLYSATSSDDNTALGYQSLYSNTAGINNTANGVQSLYFNTEGNFNTALGYQSLRSNTTGSSNTAFGARALYSNATGTLNVAVGRESLYSNTSGDTNTATGYRSLYSNTTGSNNTAMGHLALFSNATGTSNIAIGRESLYFNTGSHNIAIGLDALYNNINGDDNTVVGYKAGLNVSSANNILLGYQAADNLTTGANNIVIGYDVDIASTTRSNQLNIGNLIFGTGVDGTGTSLSSGNIGIGTTTPGSRFVIEKLTFTGAGVAGITQNIRSTNVTASAVQYGNFGYLYASNTATTTIAGNMFKIEDNTTFGNTIRGFEVQTDRGINTLGENTALSGFARTFGVRGTTKGDAGGTYEPAGVFAETMGTTQGNAIRGYSSTITSASLLKLFQDSSTFTGTGLQMNFGNSGGSFSSTTASKFIDLQNAGTSMFTVGAYGKLTIGDGTTNNNAGIQVGYGGICVDNDGSCNASTTGRISAVSYHTGNSDLAETYFSNENLKAGEVVYIKGGLSVGRAGEDSKDKVIGVVSTKPGLLLGFDDTSLKAGEKSYPIALKGRVPVRLSTENGEIKAGDELMLSSIPGAVMKASSTGKIVGVALEDFDGSRAYSDTYINQFGDDLVDPVFEPISKDNDPRINDGCYFGGGNASGDEACIPLVSTTTDGQVVEAEALARREAEERALARLANVSSDNVTLGNGQQVQVGQIVMFVDLRNRTLDEVGTEMILAFTAQASSTDNNEESETVWQRLLNLANNFVDGVLSVFTLKADKVEVKDQLCVDGVCVTGDDLRKLLNNNQTTNTENNSSNDNENNESSTNNDNQEVESSEENTEGEIIEENNPPNDTSETIVEDSPPESVEEVLEEEVMEVEEVIEEIEESEIEVVAEEETIEENNEVETIESSAEPTL